jgi:hypothetical protein
MSLNFLVFSSTFEFPQELIVKAAQAVQLHNFI